MTLQGRAIFDHTVTCEEQLLAVETKPTGFAGFCVLGFVFFYIWAAFILGQHEHNPNRAGSVRGTFGWLLSHELLCLVEQ